MYMANRNTPEAVPSLLWRLIGMPRRTTRQRLKFLACRAYIGNSFDEGKAPTGYAEHRSRSTDAVTRVYDEAGNVIETHEHKGEFKEP
jgi:hypothetical protein